MLPADQLVMLDRPAVWVNLTIVTKSFVSGKPGKEANINLI